MIFGLLMMLFDHTSFQDKVHMMFYPEWKDGDNLKWEYSIWHDPTLDQHLDPDAPFMPLV